MPSPGHPNQFGGQGSATERKGGGTLPQAELPLLGRAAWKPPLRQRIPEMYKGMLKSRVV